MTDLEIALSILCLYLGIRCLEAKERLHAADEDKRRYGEEIRQQMDAEMREAARKQAEKFNQDNVDILSQAVASQSIQSLQASIKTLIEQRYGRMTQEFVGSLGDEAETLVRDLQFELCEKIWDVFQWYKESYKDSPVILPEGIKLAYTKGVRTVIIVEQKPQVRTVSFDSELVKTQAVAALAQSRASQDSWRFRLAFPYVYFVIAFDDGNYRCHEVYFRNKPLTSAREHLHLAPLPNVWREGNKPNTMCMGDGFYKKISQEASIARQAELVISDFWQKTFNDHLGDGGYGSLDKRIENCATWQTNSDQDPLFILQISWPKGKTVKGIVEHMIERREKRNTNLDRIDQVIRNLLEEGVAKITTGVKANIQMVKTSNHQNVELEQVSKELLSNVVLTHTKKVFGHCTK